MSNQIVEAIEFALENLNAIADKLIISPDGGLKVKQKYQLLN